MSLGKLQTPADMMAVVALAAPSLGLERQVTKREQSLVEVKRKLQVADSVVLSAPA